MSLQFDTSFILPSLYITVGVVGVVKLISFQLDSQMYMKTIELLSEYGSEFESFINKRGMLSDGSDSLVDAGFFYANVKQFLVSKNCYNKRVYDYLTDEIYKSENNAVYVKCECGGLNKTPGDFIMLNHYLKVISEKADKAASCY